MNKTTKKKLLNYVVAPLIMVLLLVLIYRQISSKGNLNRQWSDFVMHWHAGDKLLLSCVVLLAPLNWMMEALKWKLLLQKIQPLSFGRALASTLTGISFSIVTPNKIGDFAGRILYLENRNKLRAAIATLVSNLSQTMVTCIFGIAGLVYFNIRYPGTWPMLTLAVAALSSVCLGFLYLNIDKVAGWAEHKAWLRKVIVAVRILKRYSKRDLLQLLLISAGRFCIYNFQFLLLANVLGAGLPWAAGFLVSGLMFWMITVIPSFFLADLGVRWFVAGLLFTDTGLAANSLNILASSSMIWLLNLALPAIVGSVLLLTVRLSK